MGTLAKNGLNDFPFKENSSLGDSKIIVKIEKLRYREKPA